MRRQSHPRKHHEAGGQPQGLELDSLLPGIKINTCATDFAPIEQLQLKRFKGEKWDLFGDIISGERQQTDAASCAIRVSGQLIY